MHLKEFFSLFWLNVKVGIRNVIEFFKVACRYYGSFLFLKADISLLLMYLFHNPYTISKRFLKKQGAEDVYLYGETPLTSMAAIAKACGIHAGDHVFELGSGRGRTAFWLRALIGCSVTGIEQVPEFVDRADLIVKRLRIDRLHFRCGDILQSDYTGATVCYLYGTCLDEAAIKRLAEIFSKFPPGTKIITVSYPLTDYTDRKCFEVMKHFTVPYTWGKAEVFLQVVRHPVL